MSENTQTTSSGLEQLLASPVVVEVIHLGPDANKWGFTLASSAFPTLEITHDTSPHIEAYTKCCSSPTYDATGGAFSPIHKCRQCRATVRRPIRGVMPYVGLTAWLDGQVREELNLTLFEKEVLLDAVTDRVLYLFAALKTHIGKDKYAFDNSQKPEVPLGTVLTHVAAQESRPLDS